MKDSGKNISLSRVQQWMQSVIEHPGTNDESWKSDRAQSALPYDDAMAEVLPSKTLSPVERIAIYRRMFFLRMTESMAIDYPGVKHLLGEKAFERLIAEEYVQQYPSQSYTLNHLGRSFPQFIQESDLAQKDFLYDLAMLELSITNMMDEEESPLLTRQEITSVPPEKWETAQLIPIAALVLLRCGHNVCEYLDAVNEDSEVPDPKKGESYVIVYRSNYRMFWEELTVQQYTLLSDLASGKRFGESIASFEKRFPDTHDDVQKNLFQWFGEWVGSGYFSKIKF